MTGTGQSGGTMDDSDDAKRRRPGQTQQLSRVMARVMAPALKKRGLTRAELLIDWPQIVGSYFAAHTAPIRLTYPRGRSDAGILHLAVAPALATAIQHDAPRLIERINVYVGHHAIGRLKLVAQSPARPQKQHRAVPRPRRPDPQPSPALAGIAAEPLRHALNRLARHFPEGAPDPVRRTITRL